MVSALAVPVRASSDPSVVVIMLEGLNSSSDEHGAVFMHLWPAVQQLAPDAVRIDYSYRGGAFDDNGNWVPRPYSSCDTHQSVLDDAVELGDAITSVRAVWPTSRIAVVGHSLGGFVAATWLATVESRPTTGIDLPDVAITVDSPLQGISPQHASFGWIAGQQANCPSLRALPELVDVYRGGSARASIQQGVDLAVQQGTRVVMVENDDDIAYGCCRGNDVVAPKIEQSQSLAVDGAEVWAYSSIEVDLPGLDPAQPTSHHAALFNGDVVQRLAAALTGADAANHDQSS
jgi:hypothetical protein